MAIHGRAVVNPLHMWISLVQLSRPRTSPRARTRTSRRRGANRCREAALQVEERYRFANRKHHQPRCAPHTIAAPGRLKGLGHAGVDIGSTVENRPALLPSDGKAHLRTG